MIKKYLEFISYIKENNQNLDNLYLTDDYIKEFFYELIYDYRYNIDIINGVFKQRKIYDKNIFSFYTHVISGKVNKGYEIFIEIPDKRIDDNLTELFESSILRLIHYTNYNYYLELDYYTKQKVKLDEVEFKDGMIVVEKTHQKYFNAIYVYLYDKEETFITDLQVVDYYNWKYDYKDEQDHVYIEYDFVQLVKDFLSDKDRYYNLLTNPDSIHDYYYSSDYEPDLESFFNYYLDKDNTQNLIEKMVDINGGYKKVIGVFEDDKEYSESEIYTYLVNNPKKLQYLDDTDLLDEITTLCGSYLCDAHIEENSNDIKTAFFKELNKIIQYDEVKLEDKTIYRIKFDSEWYIDRNYDSNDMSNFKHIADVMYEWIYHEGMTFTINPYFSDYGDMDVKEFNKEVKSILSV